MVRQRKNIGRLAGRPICNESKIGVGGAKMKIAIAMSLLFSVGKFIAMDQHIVDQRNLTVKNERWQQCMTCHLSQPVHTVLLYGTVMFSTDGRRGDRCRQGIFLTVFGPDDDGETSGEVYSADDCSQIYKTNIPWSSVYESRKGKPIEIQHIKIGGKWCSLKIQITDEKSGIIQVLKEDVGIIRNGEK